MIIVTNQEKVLQALRTQVKRHGDNKSAYANEVGLTVQYISQLINGKNSIGALSLERLEQLFPDIITISFDWNNSLTFRDKIIMLIDSLSVDEQQRAYEILDVAFKPTIASKKEIQK